MYDITYTFAESKRTKRKLLKMNEEQVALYQITYKKFQGVAMLKQKYPINMNEEMIDKCLNLTKSG